MSTPAKSIPIPADLPPTAAQTTAEHPWPLRLLSSKMEEYIARMSRMWVEGEVTSLVRRAGAKVQYFVLTDLHEKVSINVKMYSHNLPAGINPGARVVLLAKPDFWRGNGSLTLFADEIRPVGLGDLLARLEALKAKLAAEGLFAAARKQPLPFLPRKIGLICGRNTKAKDDVVVNSRARWPEVQFEIREVQVQGVGSVPAMIAALAELDADPSVDVIVLARGGGAMEDLLPFSDEALVRAAAAAKTPIVSAIGHETDNPILDYVADLRASTPTDAAKRIVPDVGEQRMLVASALDRGRRALQSAIDARALDITQLRARPALARPEDALDARSADITNLRAWSLSYAQANIERNSAALRADLARLRTLSPLSTLKRGYSILRTTEGNVVSEATQVAVGDALHATLASGELDLSVAATNAPTR